MDIPVRPLSGFTPNKMIMPSTPENTKPTNTTPARAGLMFIGDPHLEGRTPGFRKDDFAQTALKKFAWCLEFARSQNLQPFLLGDLFHLPQDNPNWLITAIIDTIHESFGQPIPAIYGNHDIRENSRKPNDSISILFSGGHLQLISAENPWIGEIEGKRVVVGGTVWRDSLPKSFLEKPIDTTTATTALASATSAAPDLVAWITHDDILIPGYEEAGRIRPKKIPGIDLIVNGHIHRRLPPVIKGHTHWVTAGNITRRARSDASREHLPAVPVLVPANNTTIIADESVASLEIHSLTGTDWSLRWVRVPHEPFDEIFYPAVAGDTEEDFSAGGSGFIADLREMTQRRTDTGAGLMAYLEKNIDQFDAPVATEIMRLAAEVTATADSQIFNLKSQI